MLRKIIPDVVHNQFIRTVAETVSVREAARQMAERQVGALLVMREGRLAGIVTERDIAVRVVAKGLSPEATPVAMVMTQQPDSLNPGDTASAALEKMQRRGCRHLPVVDVRGAVVGMVSLRDLHRAVQADLEADLRDRDRYIFGDAYGT